MGVAVCRRGPREVLGWPGQHAALASHGIWVSGWSNERARGGKCIVWGAGPLHSCNGSAVAATLGRSRRAEQHCWAVRCQSPLGSWPSPCDFFYTSRLGPLHCSDVEGMSDGFDDATAYGAIYGVEDVSMGWSRYAQVGTPWLQQAGFGRAWVGHGTTLRQGKGRMG
jgi:hypothetical protein